MIPNPRETPQPQRTTDERTPPPEVLAFYERTPEESRLETGPFPLEFERSKEILRRVLPPPPARIVDVGGAAGAYSLWLAGLGYETHLVDAVPRLVEEARRRSDRAPAPLASAAVADARRLPQPDAWAAAVLVMGPLYHLPQASDRLEALAEARRVTRPGGLVVAAAISRYATALSGVAQGLGSDPRFRGLRDRGLAEGLHVNDTGNDRYFTTAYLHRPEELGAELASAGLEDVAVLGVEGPGWMAPDFAARWADREGREDLVRLARVLESEPAIVGVSAHLLALGRRPATP